MRAYRKWKIQFKETRKSMVGGKSEAEIKRNVQTLKSMIVTDAKVLDEVLPRR